MVIFFSHIFPNSQFPTHFHLDAVYYEGNMKIVDHDNEGGD